MFWAEDHCELDNGNTAWFLDYACDSQKELEGIFIISEQTDDGYIVHAVVAEFLNGEEIAAGSEFGAQILRKVNLRVILPIIVLIFAIVIVIILIEKISLCLIFIKAEQPGWAAFVPYYNLYVYAEVGEKSGWTGIIAGMVQTVPVIGYVISKAMFAMISIGVAQTFGRGVLFGLGLCFLPLIFYPILALSKIR